MTNIPETRYVRSGDADLAYQVFGSGADLVAIHGLPGHLEVMWELPEFAAFLDRLGTFGRVIMFDKRGTGMSDRVPGVPAAEQHMEDIIAVMDAAGSSRASVAGWADGAFMAAMLAATYPDRVSARVLGGLCLKALTGGRQPGLALDPDAIKALSDRIEAGWRQGLVAPVLAPSYTDDEHFRSWWRRLERYSATPSGAAALLRWAACVDPAPILPAIQAPTLVLERAEPYHDQASNRVAAAQIAGARYVDLPDVNALPYLGDADAVLDEIEEFLTGARSPADFDRSLATVLFTDIVGSTEKAGDLGDRRWRYLLEDHHARVRRALGRFHGTEVDTAGDGFFATFDGPARAIRRACAIRDSLRDIGVPIRAGLHTGEVERRGTGTTGLAVHVGARVAALAQASEVLVTSTVKMLVLGSGIGFADRGRHRLKGVPDQWQLFAVEHT
ncbi:MAG TPA: adenylate/guanylate cyclase domain-containing protein [Streptosporangiaceae bacterium]|jgi:class 3 adenylate cyclase|nr:adenylate/guanylate cyclase domain-containing protein [Streptosporangiaceae bacterium]